jgi:hypothetical protein
VDRAIDVFDPSWSAVVEAVTVFNGIFDVPPDVAAPQAAIGVVRPLGDQPITLEPGMSPPPGFTVNGVDAATASQRTGLTPILEWQPPALGSPTLYKVVVDPLSSIYPSVTIYTTETRLQVLPGILHSTTRHHCIHVAALDGALDPVRPFRYALSGSWAEVLSGQLTP